jgi:hypothetical protein
VGWALSGCANPVGWLAGWLGPGDRSMDPSPSICVYIYIHTAKLF